jgi:3-oxoacyl-[acyl-carrier protein] reductase
MQPLGPSVMLITGAATGLGAATALAAAAAGARLVLGYRSSREQAEETAQACRSMGAEVVIAQADVSQAIDCRGLVEAAATWGRLDALINCAAATVYADAADLDALSAEDFHRLYAVNVVGPYQMIAAARGLLEAAARLTGRASAVVNVSSVGALNGTGSSIAYAASKGGLNTMTLALARALAPLIRVNAICPGFIDTPWLARRAGEDTAKATMAWAARTVPLQVATSADDVAAAVLFLAGPQSRNMTGEIIGSDAGLRLLAPMPTAADRGAQA